MEKKNIGIEKALEKIRHFCSYQERNHQEVKEKLYSFGLYKKETESILSQLIEENYLNEERYAIAFAGGKFRMKQWGKIKIKYELKQRRVSDYCIRASLALIPADDYDKTLEKLFEDKRKSLKSEKNIFMKKRKIQAYLMQKGFEPALISAYLKKL